jgi:hypothetical protein
MVGMDEGHQGSADARHLDSWIEISSQPSSSSLSSAADEIVTTGLRVHQMPASYRRRRQRPGRPSRLNIASRAGSAGPASSQEEYEESESDDDDHIITSSGEGLTLPHTHVRGVTVESSDDDENRTAATTPSTTITSSHHSRTPSLILRVILPDMPVNLCQAHTSPLSQNAVTRQDTRTLLVQRPEFNTRPSTCSHRITTLPLTTKLLFVLVSPPYSLLLPLPVDCPSQALAPQLMSLPQPQIGSKQTLYEWCLPLLWNKTHPS